MAKRKGQKELPMLKMLSVLRKLVFVRKKGAEAPSIFDQRLEQMGQVRPVSVARAVLFRTAP